MLLNYKNCNVDMGRREVFHAVGHDQRIRQIMHQLERGGAGLQHLLQPGWAMESAVALQQFLRHLKKPLIPQHIQALALDDNPGVPPEVVAQDMLGLLRQDVEGRHYVLITMVLDLLYCTLKQMPSDELSGSYIPITMLSVFFNMQAEHIIQWRRIATIFLELIRMAPEHLNFPVEDAFLDDRLHVENFDFQHRLYLNQVLLQQQVVEASPGLRRHSTGPGHQGDTHGFDTASTQRPLYLGPRRFSTNSIYTLNHSL
ncbi:hypothetical protein FQA39_LY05950 [Lamprigera yunnana]|nr:hypothetical protein FQA39_LY05950 [Lamprigera yunnana]